MKKIIGKITAVIAVTAMVITGLTPIEARAWSTGSNVFEMDCDEEYTSYDITGDGVPDSITLAMGKRNDEGDADGFNIMINGSECFVSTQRTSYAEMTLIKLKSGSQYLYVRAFIENDDYNLCEFLRYDAAKDELVKVCNADPMVRFGIHTDCDPYFANGAKIYCIGGGMLDSTGDTSYDVIFTEKNGKLVFSSLDLKGFTTMKTASKKNNTTKKLTLARNMKAYTSTALKKTKTFKKGKKITFTSMKVKGRNLLYGFKVSGKTYYYRPDDRTVENDQFKDVLFAG